MDGRGGGRPRAVFREDTRRSAEAPAAPHRGHELRHAGLSQDGQPVFAFNSQKQYISLYVPPAVHEKHAEAMKGLDAGKSCIRFRKGEQIDFDLLDRLLADTAEQPSSC
ncbi:DUF1801 domain-containing protein [Phenylobacterium sp.]|uniref:DUF1801 domain-containing protein n=1 Tax=Phenylobacterium sp. TaxID=1871053 RepID=UPI002F92A6DF